MSVALQSLPQVKITSLSGAIDLAAQNHIKHVVSAVDPLQAKKMNKLADNHLILDFSDQEIQDYSSPPTPAHIKKFIRWGRQIKWKREDFVLIHCHAGLCRSPALAIGFIIDRLIQSGMNKTEAIIAAFNRVLIIRPQAWPNIMVLRLLDAELELDGELIDHAMTWRTINIGKWM